MSKPSIFGSYFSSQRPLFSMSDRVWNPPTDIYEIAGATAIRMEVAGIDEEQLKIISKGHTLIVKGQRLQPLDAGAVVYQMMEVHYGSFERHFVFNFPLEEVAVKAHYEKGFLTIEVPKAPAKSRSRNVEIKIIAEERAAPADGAEGEA